ncbi:MAG: methyltransferase domain-containing protein [Dehalococcoidia bacterium]|nr:methyltransferase domain-containing protein [Dehalococcoidia bacterium]
MKQGRSSVPSSTYGQERMLSLNAPGEYERFLQDGQLRPRLARAVYLAGVSAGQWLLDLGCGRGEVAAYCAREGGRVLALDYSADCLGLTAWAARQVEAGPSGRVMPVQGDTKGLPVRANSVSRVLLLDVVEHLYPWELDLALAEAYRVLRPGGYLVIHTLPNRWALEIGYPLARFFIRRLPADPRSEIEQAIHVNEQDILGLHRALSRVGFTPRVWLEDSILAQARWQRGGKALLGSDHRASVYRLLGNPFLRAFYRLLLASPLRIILANDIYAVGVKGPVPSGKQWGGWMERLLAAALPAQEGAGKRGDGKP